MAENARQLLAEDAVRIDELKARADDFKEAARIQRNRAEAAEQVLREIANAPADVDAYWLRKLARAILNEEDE